MIEFHGDNPHFELDRWTLPCGLDESGRPASVQVVGRAGDDALVLGAGLALERALAA